LTCLFSPLVLFTSEPHCTYLYKYIPPTIYKFLFQSPILAQIPKQVDPIQCQAIRFDCGCYGQHQAARISNAGEQRKHLIKSVDKLRSASKVTHCANGATTSHSRIPSLSHSATCSNLLWKFIDCFCLENFRFE